MNEQQIKMELHAFAVKLQEDAVCTTTDAWTLISRNLGILSMLRDELDAEQEHGAPSVYWMDELAAADESKRIALDSGADMV